LYRYAAVVGNCTGFAVNRVFFPYTMSACLLLDLGCDPYAIDNAIRMFGMPMVGGLYKLNPVDPERLKPPGFNHWT
jgi:3-hydroxyacyl-CoA dehydrogenase